MKLLTKDLKPASEKANTLSPVAKMCLWFKRKPDIESPPDPRFGNSNITAPISGAYADPVDPPITILVGAQATQTNNEPSSPFQIEMRERPEPSQQIHPEFRKDSSSKISPRTSTAPSHSPHESPQSANSRRRSNSTQFSSHTSQSPSNSPQPSPTHSKSSPPIGGPNQTLPSNPKQNLPSSDPSSRATSPTPIPAHQAYIPTDQLSIGSKLAGGSPNFYHSTGTTPTTAGPQTGGSFGSRNGSTAVSPIEGWNSFGKRESDASSSHLMGNSNTHKGSLGMIFGSKSEEKKQKEEDRAKIEQAQPAPVTPPWEKRNIPVKIGVSSVQPQQPEGPAREMSDENIGGTGMKESKARVRRSFLPSIKLGNVPMKMGVVPKTPASPSPEDEQWPGRF